MINVAKIHSLESLINFSETIGELIDEDVAVAICDKEKIIKFIPSKNIEGLAVKEGMLLPEESALKKCIKRGETVNELLPKSAYGVSFRSISNCIFDENNKVIGAISISKSLEIHNLITESASNLSESINQISLNVSELASDSEELAYAQDNMLKSSEIVIESINQINNIIGLISNIAKQTKMLGLNAAIEAARAGIYGSGFSVVANEVRKLSVNSSEAIIQMREIFEQATNSFNNIKLKILDNSASVQQQAAATEEINSSLEELNSISKTLVMLGNKL